MSTLVQPQGAAPPLEPIRVMVVDDSVFVRGIVSNWLGENPEFLVVATHANGRRATDDIERTQPDVVILDLEMPEMDGLTALPLILARRPNTMVVVASTLTRRGAEVSLKALTLGAADYLPKPDAGRGIAAADEFKRDLISKVRSLGQKAHRRVGKGRPAPTPAATTVAAPAVIRASAAAAPATHAAPAGAAAAKARGPEKMRPYSMAPISVLAVGSSTGGPQALTRVFTEIGPYLGSIPVVIAQHMPVTFTAILAEHVSRAAGRPAAEGQDGEAIQPGRIYVAAGGKHMLVEKSNGQNVIRVSDAPPVNFCKPAVDPLFGAVAQTYGRGTLALVLTGMGSDGAKGAGLILDAGGSVIAQDEETSVVWGMPGATVALGNVCDILPIDGISRKVVRLLTGGRA